MAVIRILIDGYSLLHSWPELARGRARHSAAARDELIHRLTLYQDAIGTPITVFFDGSGAPNGTPAALSRPELEVLYSRSGQTADHDNEPDTEDVPIAELCQKPFAHLCHPFSPLCWTHVDEGSQDRFASPGVCYLSPCADWHRSLLSCDFVTRVCSNLP